MEITNMISFARSDVKNLLEDLDIPVRKIGTKDFILNDNGNIAKCHVCEMELTVEQLGNIAKGSKLLFCDNPRCFATHLAKQKL